MPLNLELKVKLSSHLSIKKIFKEIDAKFKMVLFQKDIYYQNNSGLLKLRIENDHTELIKYNRDESGKARWSEYEIVELSGENPEKFFNSIFKTEAIVEKKRELWFYDNTRIHLDSVKNLGNFLELETLVIKGKKDAQLRFNTIVTKLNLDLKSQILSSYKNLIMNK